MADQNPTITPDTPGSEITWIKPNIPDCWSVQPVDQITQDQADDNNG